MEGEPHFKEAIDEVWYAHFGHGYNHCVQLSQIPGEIGQIHLEHLNYIKRIVNLPHETDTGGSSQA